MEIKNICRWTWDASHGSRWNVLIITLIGTLRVAAGLVFVWLSKLLIDTATNQAVSEQKLWSLALLLIGSMVLDLVLSQEESYLGTRTSAQMNNRLRHSFFSNILRSNIYNDPRHSGDILNRLTVDIGTVTSTVVSTIPLIFVMLVQFAAALYILCTMSPMLALIILIITPLFFFIGKFYIFRMRKLNAEVRNQESLIHTAMQEGVQHRVTIQTLECHGEMEHRLDNIQGSLLRKIIERVKVSIISHSAMRAGFMGGYLTAFIWSIFHLHSGAITFGMMTAFLQLVGRIQGPISSLASSIPTLVSTTTAIERLSEISNATQTTDAQRIDGPLGIRISNLSFGYGQSAPIFSDFSHDFKPGSKTLIMGETGAGKSTLARLMLALLEPQSGSIETYGPTISATASPSTRCNIIYVPQGNSLLAGTIRENLLLADPDASPSRLQEVLHTAVADFVYELPQGLDTPCGEHGYGLSEGQCQRIAIARALLHGGSILILDEFNSALDNDTANTLIQRLTETCENATIIFISHRQEVSAHCDNILRIGISKA